MRKKIRLTESDLIRLVNKVIKETESNPRAPYATHTTVGDLWVDADDSMIEDEPMDYSEEKEFGPEDYGDFMDFISNCNTQWCLKTKRMYDMYAKEGPIKVRK